MLFIAVVVKLKILTIRLQVVEPAGINWELDITLGFDPVDPSELYQPFPSVARIGPDPDDRSGKWYRGDCHVHTVYSDGGHTPAEIVSFAQGSDLNFMFSSEHNTNAASLFFGVVDPADLLVIPAIEVTTRAGHWQAMGLDPYDWVEFRYHPGDVPGLEDAKQQVRMREGGFASFNHPFIDQGDCAACNWTYPDVDFDGIELWNGWWDHTDQTAVDFWQEQLVLGNMLVGLGGSDYHNAPVIVGYPTTKVKAKALSKGAILEGMHEHHVIILQGPDYDLDLCVRGSNGVCYDVGDYVEGSGPYEVQIETFNMNGTTASVWTQNGKLFETQIPTISYTVNYTLPDGQKWVRVEVENATSKLALTNLVFLPSDGTN
jgi:hypothetical protein